MILFRVFVATLGAGTRGRFFRGKAERKKVRSAGIKLIPAGDRDKSLASPFIVVYDVDGKESPPS